MFNHLLGFLDDHIKSTLFWSLFGFVASLCNKIGLMKDGFDKLKWTAERQAYVSNLFSILLIISAIILSILGIYSALKRIKKSF